MSLKFFLVAIFIVGAFAQASMFNCTTSTCNCVSNTNEDSFAYGDQFGLCVHFVRCMTSTGICESMRASYPLTVDNFTVVELKDGQTKYALGAGASSYDAVKIVVQAHGTTYSYPIDFVNFTGGAVSFYANVYSLVISVHKGQIFNVTWDDKCGLCEEDSNECKTINLADGLTDQLCNAKAQCAAPATTQCDPKIFVSWIGSDKNNRKMTSAGMRLARFRNFDMSEIYTRAQNLKNVTNSTI
jgi:hypothetical protein